MRCERAARPVFIPPRRACLPQARFGKESSAAYTRLTMSAGAGCIFLQSRKVGKLVMLPALSEPQASRTGARYGLPAVGRRAKNLQGLWEP